MMKRFALPCTTALALALAPFSLHAQTAGGVDAEEASREKAFTDQVSTSNIGRYIAELTQHPTYPGSKFSPEAAKKTEEMFRSWGWATRVEAYTIPFPRPKERVVEMLTPKPFKARLWEPPIPGDAYSAERDDYLPPYFIYGPDGDVTAPVIYVNFGLRNDYEELETLGQSVKGKIVIVRAGGMWRGGKLELAAEHGAVGMLIYSDPKEDGYYRGDAYPKGAWRSEDGVQRGSVLYGIYPGDPLTPSEPATENAHRLKPNSPESSYGRIPAMPLSYADARPILDAIEGPIAPERWRGALPIPYRVGCTSAPVHLKIVYDKKTITIRNVIATLPGSSFPDEEVVRGNHRDGWSFGAQDPHSGHSAMLEEARVLGKLYKDGWRPKRTLIYASWDAEEQGVIGSTEYVEAHLSDLQHHAVAYINTDMTGPGSFSAVGSASYAGMVTNIASAVTDPNSGVSVLQRAIVKSKVNLYSSTVGSALGSVPTSEGFNPASNEILLGAPGYSSDHHSFMSHAGVPTLNLAFGAGDVSLGTYHTGYDDLSYYKRFGDPGFLYGAATAQVNGMAVMRLADAELLPMDFVPTAADVKTQVDALKTLYRHSQAVSAHIVLAEQLDAYKVLNDKTQPRFAPTVPVVPVLDFSPMEQATSQLSDAANRFRTARRSVEGKHLSPSSIARINAAMLAVEQASLRSPGLPDRPHYRNELYSPGRLWDTVPLPAVGDAILDARWDVASAQIPLTASTINHMVEAIDAATAAIGGSLNQ